MYHYAITLNLPQLIDRNVSQEVYLSQLVLKWFPFFYFSLVLILLSQCNIVIQYAYTILSMS